MSGVDVHRLAGEVLEDMLDDPADTGQGRRDAARSLAGLDRDELVEVVLELGRRWVRLELDGVEP